MTQYAIITDLNKCVGCLACSVACKSANEVPIGSFWNKVLRIGPNPRYEGAVLPDVDMYFLPVGCQHCAQPECVAVCPTGASHKLEDGTVQIDKSKCIGCQFCAMACPYGVRYLNEEERVVEKCTLCEQKVAQGELPQCVAQCGARARFFGDLDAGYESFMAPGRVLDYDATYDQVHDARVPMLEAVRDFSDDQVVVLPDVGNKPSFAYILRDKVWQGGGE
ncbi:MAG TPA: 4Fe-4S dicluster domain-containing protein [Candidatus Rubneribacter avistercoris]|nr:4Fe-4S dicluster domain-containing protein [Candidatus Rubneribacter avistercoris]